MESRVNSISLRERFRDRLIGGGAVLTPFKGKDRFFRWLGLAISPFRGTVALCRLKNGYWVYIDPRSPDHLSAYFIHQYEANLVSLIDQFTKTPRPVFLDIGASVGLISFSTLREIQLRNGRVIAFEPFPTNLVLLHNSILKNRCSNVMTAVPLAVGSTPGIVKMNIEERLASAGNASISTMHSPSQRSALSCDVRMSTLDLEVERLKIDKIDFMKIDVEGWEPYVLRGGSKVIEKLRPPIYAEFNVEFLERNEFSRSTAWESVSCFIGYRIFRFLGRAITPLSGPPEQVPRWDVLLVPEEKVHMCSLPII